MLLPALLAVGLSAAVARADDEEGKGWRPDFVAFVPKDKLKAAFPKGATATGEVMLACVAGADGRLVDCKVAKEDPAGQGFGEAALSVVRYERIRTKDEAGASTAGRPVRTRFTFLAPGDADPNWVRQPNGQDLANVFPTKALEQRIGGRATISCDVTVEGFLQNCKVRSETPAGLGFGQAGLQLAPQFRMSPKIRGGKAVPGGEVTIPIIWQEPSQTATYASSPVVLDPPWSRVPTQAEVAAAWPQRAAGLPSGQAALRCAMTAEGRLRNCDVISENPRDKGFGKAAIGLSKLFQVNVAPEDAKRFKLYKVDLPFRFRDPAAPDARKLTKPRWIRTLTPEGMALAYPAAAVKAGVTTGQGTARCVVTATGELTDCQAVRETPVGLDFGAAAIKAVSAMRMNPWTREGDTVDGLVITIPVQFTFENDAPSAEPPKPGQGG